MQERKEKGVGERRREKGRKGKGKGKGRKKNVAAQQVERMQREGATRRSDEKERREGAITSTKSSRAQLRLTDTRCMYCPGYEYLRVPIQIPIPNRYLRVPTTIRPTDRKERSRAHPEYAQCRRQNTECRIQNMQAGS